MQQKQVFTFIAMAMVFLFMVIDSSSLIYGLDDNISLNSGCNKTINISNEGIFPSPVFQGESPTLQALINGTNLSSVWVESSHNGLLVNYSNVINALNIYNFSIPYSELDIGEIVTWRYYANNSCGAVTQGNLQFFVVLGTSLIINPSVPDGENGWYKSIPIITLMYNNFGVTFYRFNSLPNIIYIGPFNGTEDTDTGGVSELRYFSRDISTRIEPIREFTTKVDFTKPAIVDEHPEGGSTSNNTPLINITLREVYQGNSGLDDSSVILMLDGNVITHEYLSISPTYAEVRHQVNNSLINGTHNISVFVKDFAGNKNSRVWDFYVNNDLFDINVSQPTDEFLSNKRRVLFEINVSRVIQQLELGVNGRFTRMCGNCEFFNKTRTLKEGLNNITVRGTNFGNLVNQFLEVYVDTVKPKIKSTVPKVPQVTNGTFKVKYSESDLQSVRLYWNVSGNYNEVALSNCSSGENQECETFVNLSGYDNQRVGYYFNVSDRINEVSSKLIRGILIDTITPSINRINPQNGILYGNNVLFEIEISENASVSFIDNSDSHPRLKNLCKNCDSYNKTLTFSGGSHNITFIANDAANNLGINTVEFDVLD